MHFIRDVYVEGDLNETSFLEDQNILKNTL